MRRISFGGIISQSVIRVGFCLTLLVAGVFALSNVAYAQTGNVIGKFTSPDGTEGVASSWVYVHDASWATSKSTTTDSNGNWSVYDLAPGTYKVKSYAPYPWSKSYSPPAEFDVTVEADKTTDLGKVKYRANNITGKIVDGNGNAVTGYYLSASSTGYTNYSYAYAYTDSGGNFSMYLPDANTYTLFIYDDSNRSFHSPGNKSFELTTTEQAYDFGTIQGKSPNVIGRFKDKNGNVISSTYPYGYLYKSGWSESKYTNIDRTTGEFKFFASEGTWYLSLYGGGNGGQDPDTITVEVPASGVKDVGTIRQTAPNALFTVVEPNGTTPVTNGSGYIHTADWRISKYANLNSSGQLEFTLTQSGTYTLDVYSWSSTYADPDPVTFTYTAGNSVSQTLTMQQPAMRGSVVDASGNAVQGLSVYVHDSSWMNSGWGYSDSTGAFTIRRALPTGTYDVSMSYYNYYGGTNLIPPDDFSISLTRGTTDTTYVTTPLRMSAPTKTINVNVKYPNGNAVTDANVSGWKQTGSGYFYGQVNSNGLYTTTVGPGTWQISVYPTWSGGSPAWGYFDSATTVTFDLDRDTLETKSKEITVTPFNSRITGKVLKPDGSVPSSSDYTSVSVYQDKGFYNWSQPDSNGAFTVKVPAGKHKVQVYTSSTTYAAPEVQSWSVGEDEEKDIGILSFVEKKEKIIVTIVDTAGNPIENQYSYAYKDNGGYGWAWGQTDSTGKVTLNVTTGDWVAMTYGSYWYGSGTTQYVPLESSKKVELTKEETENVQFTMGVATATITGSIKDPDGNVISSGYGWISVRNSSSTDTYGSGLGGSVSGGGFSVKVPAGTWILRYNTWGNTEYDTAGEVTVTVADSETYDGGDITLIPANSTLSGSLVDADGNAITDLSASIYAENGAGANKYVWTNDGNYSFNVSESEWTVGAWVSWGSDYVVSPQQDKTVTVGDDEDVDFDITLLHEDSTVSGTVTNEAGEPVQNVWVSLKTKKGGETTSSYRMYRSNYEFGALTDDNGNYELSTTPGEWFVTPKAPEGSGYMNPEAVKVDVDASSPADVDFVLLTPDVTITGQALIDGTATPAYIFAYSDEGATTSTTTEDGTFELPATSDDTWHVGAVYEEDNENTYYEAVEVKVIAEEENTTYNADLSLTQSPIDVPDAESVTFGSDETATLELSDGTNVTIPAYAITEDSDQLLTVTATPVVEDVAHTATEQPVGLMYDFQAVKADGEDAGSEITSFASEVTVTIPYTTEILEYESVEEDEIQPTYWDETRQDYSSVNNVVVDEDNDTASFTINHFTKFGIIASGTADATETVPAVTLTLPPEGATVSAPQVVVQGTVSDEEASVDISLNGTLKESPAVASDGSFEATVTDLQLGTNTISVVADNNVGSSEAVTRTVTFTVTGAGNEDTGAGDGSGADGAESGENGETGGTDGNDTPNLVVSAIVKNIVIYPNEGAPHLRVYNGDGEYLRGFFAYSPSVRGSYNVLTTDLDADGSQEIITATGDGLAPQVRVFDSEGELLTHFYAFDATSRFGVKIAIADLTGDGLPELLTWPRGKAAPHLRAYSYDTDAGEFELLAQTFAYSENFRGAMNLTVADVTGDGNQDIVVSPEQAAASHVRVFTYEDEALELVSQFFAFGETSKFGVKVLTGDLDGDGVRDLIVAPATAGASNIRFYRYNSTTETFDLLGWTLAFGEDWRGTFNIRVADLDRDGQVEVVTAPHTYGGPNVRIYRYNALTQVIELVDWFMAYSETFHGGVDFAITNLDGDNYSEIVTTPRRFGGSILRVYEYDTDELGYVLRDWVLTHNPEFRGQLTVMVSDLTGDGDSELVVAPREVGSGGANVRIFNWNADELALELQKWFVGFPAGFRGGVKATTINE